MVVMEIQISPGISKRFHTALEKEYPAVGWVFGWHTHAGIICIGCVASSGTSSHDLLNDLEYSLELLPAGLDVVGIFACGLQQYSENKVNDYFEQLQISGFQILNETNEFCFLTQSYQDKECHGYLYNSAQGQCLPVTIKQIELSELSSIVVNCHIKGSMTLVYEKSADKVEDDCLNDCFEDMKKKLSSPITAFHLTNSNVLVQASPTFRSSTNTVLDDTPCQELWEYINNEGDGDPFSVKKTEDKLKIMNWKMLMQVTGEKAVEQTISCLPLIHYEHRNFDMINVSIPVDIMALVPKYFPVGKLPQAFIHGICRHLNKVKHCILQNKQFSNCVSSVESFHFLPPECYHFVSILYPKGVAESDLEAKRRQLHHQLLFPEDRPLFRRTNKFLFPEQRTSLQYLINPHENLPVQPGHKENIALVLGSYTYYHYMQDCCDDNGWGCAYRSLQTIVSWFRHQGYTTCSIPTHRDIQQALVDVGDKPPSFIGSKKWIGSLEVSYCLQQLIGVTSKIMNVSNGAELSNKGRELSHHFKKQGTPIMIGGGVLAHTIIGVDFDNKTGETKFLILDPHYTGADDLNTILNKGWCGWKNEKFWDATSYYNLCLPQRPLGI